MLVYVESPFDRIVNVHFRSPIIITPPPPYDQTTYYRESLTISAPQPPHVFENSDGAQGLGAGYRTMTLTINTNSYWGTGGPGPPEYKFTFEVTVVDLNTGSVLLDTGPIACIAPLVPGQANGPFSVTLPGATVAGHNLLPYLAIISLDSFPNPAIGGVGCSFRLQAVP